MPRSRTKRLGSIAEVNVNPLRRLTIRCAGAAGCAEVEIIVVSRGPVNGVVILHWVNPDVSHYERTRRSKLCKFRVRLH
jgi:hypothetical protein